MIITLWGLRVKRFFKSIGILCKYRQFYCTTREKLDVGQREFNAGQIVVRYFTFSYEITRFCTVKEILSLNPKIT